MAKASTELKKWAAERGWSCSLSRGGHLCFTKNGHKVFTAATGGRGHGYTKCKALIRRLDRQDEMKGGVVA